MGRTTDWAKGRGPYMDLFPDLASNFGSRHTADRVLLPFDGFSSSFALGT